MWLNLVKLSLNTIELCPQRLSCQICLIKLENAGLYFHSHLFLGLSRNIHLILSFGNFDLHALILRLVLSHSFFKSLDTSLD